jgi:hypothetical protein
MKFFLSCARGYLSALDDAFKSERILRLSYLYLDDKVRGKIMDNLILVIIILLALAYFIYRGYLAWFFPIKMKDKLRNAGTATKRVYSFMPKWWLSLGLLGGNETAQIWWARIISTIAILILIFVLLTLIS